MAGRIVNAITQSSLEAQTSFGSEATALAPQTVSLTGNEGSISIIAANPNSMGLVIGVPDSTDKNAFISFGQAAVLNSGIPLVAGERPFVLLSGLSALELFAISSPSGAKISWQQFVTV